MKTHYKIIGLLLLSSLFCACTKDWLEAKSDQQIAVPSNLKDFQAILDNVFRVSSSPYMLEIASDGYYLTEAVWQGYAGLDYTNMYTWSNNVPYPSSGNYSTSYSVILDCNIILEGLKKINVNNDAQRIAFDNIEGQALFQRSRHFYELTQIYAPAYSSSSADKDLGIPLRLTTDITAPSKRSNVQENYNMIIEDLLIAEDKLPVKAEFATRGSKTAVYALLARIYLAMERYDKAYEYADKCLRIKNDLVDYNSLLQGRAFIGVNKEIILISLMQSASAVTTNYLPDQSLFDLYEPNDLRKVIFFRTVSGTIRFGGHYSNSQNNPFGGLATDELYLIRAECNARLGKITEAMNDFNDLLKTRWKTVNGISTYVNKTAIDETDALKKILLERRKELILRNVRWSDLRRLNRDPRFAVTLTRIIGGSTYTLEPNSYKYTFPIPDDIIQQTNMPQNPGWQ